MTFATTCLRNGIVVSLFDDIKWSFLILLYVSPFMGKPTNCIGENTDADQLRGNREADLRLCFRYSDSTIPLLLKS